MLWVKEVRKTLSHPLESTGRWRETVVRTWQELAETANVSVNEDGN